MNSGLLVTLPLQLACHLITPGHFDNEKVSYVEDLSSFNQSSTIPSDYTAFPDIGLAYKYFEYRMTWNAARKQCLMEGGRLAVADTYRKVGFLKSMKDRSASIHVGIHRMYNNVDWYSIATGLPVSFIPWKPDANLAIVAGHCAALWYDGSGLTASDCKKALPAICEIPLYKEYRSNAVQHSNPLYAAGPHLGPEYENPLSAPGGPLSGPVNPIQGPEGTISGPEGTISGPESPGETDKEVTATTETTATAA